MVNMKNSISLIVIAVVNQLITERQIILGLYEVHSVP